MGFDGEIEQDFAAHAAKFEIEFLDGIGVFGDFEFGVEVAALEPGAEAEGKRLAESSERDAFVGDDDFSTFDGEFFDRPARGGAAGSGDGGGGVG